jgi:hypothetical protein
MFDNLLDQPVIITWVGWIRDFAKQSYGSKAQFREMVMKLRIFPMAVMDMLNLLKRHENSLYIIVVFILGITYRKM